MTPAAKLQLEMKVTTKPNSQRPSGVSWIPSKGGQFLYTAIPECGLAPQSSGLAEHGERRYLNTQARSRSLAVSPT